MLNQLHDLHIQANDDKSDIAKATAYHSCKCKQQVQRSLRTMQDTWWHDRAADLQSAADRHDYKAFYQGLKAVYGPTHKASPAIKSKEGVLLTEPPKVLDRWAEHFNKVLNQDSAFDMSVLDEFPQWETNWSLSDVPTIE